MSKIDGEKVTEDIVVLKLGRLSSQKKNRQYWKIQWKKMDGYEWWKGLWQKISDKWNNE